MKVRKKTIAITIGLLLLAGAIVTLIYTTNPGQTDLLQFSHDNDKLAPNSVQTTTAKDIQIPPEPIQRNQTPAVSPSSPKVLSDAVARLKETNPTSQIGAVWDAFLQKPPTLENLFIFLDSLDTSQLFELMEYTCESDPSFASGFMEIAIIPELKARWSQEGSLWENQVPYDQLLQIASDKQKPELLRQVMIDLLGSCKGMTIENRDVVLEQMSQGLAGIIEDTENAGDTRAYAITDLGLISQQLHGDASPYSELFLRLAQDTSEDVSVRVKSLQSLSIVGDLQAIPVIEDMCMNYQPEDDGAITKAAVVALSDFAQKNDIDALNPISRVLVTTLDSSLFSASVYAISRLDESSFLASLPALMAEKKRFQEDSLVKDSICAALWRQPNALINAINSDNEEMIQAGIEAACFVSLPPVKERLQEMLTDRPPEEHDKIRKALKRAEDIKEYDQIMNQMKKEREVSGEK